MILPYDEFLALSHIFVENSESVKAKDGFEPLEDMMQKSGMKNLEVRSSREHEQGDFTSTDAV